MGFGFLFVGYLLTFNIAYSSYTDIFAFLLMLLGLSTLSRYAKSFRSALFAGIPTAALSLVLFGERIGVLLGFWAESAAFLSYTGIVASLCKVVFLCFVLQGVAEIAEETDIPVLRLRALRNRIFTLLFLAFDFLLESGVFERLSVFLALLTVIYLLYGLVYTFLNAKLFFECYIWICLEGDEEMSRAPSRFAFINKLRAWEDKQDEKTLARKQEAARERQARKEARSSKRK
ncbi:MAG: hypothetical protein J6K61_05295 [Clostridia bacterium]|nr:hypothetical protein [Clostridia bacterium]